jgi:hypothetical protein
MTFTYVGDDYQPVDGTDDLDLTEVIVWGEVTHDATGDILASSQAQGWDFSVDVQVPIDDRCITETLTINMSQMEVDNEGGYLPDSDTEGEYLPKGTEFIQVVELAGSTIQFYPGESITLPLFDMQQDCEWQLDTLLQIIGSPTGLDAELNGDGRAEITIDNDAPAGTYTLTYSGTAVSDYDDIDDADVSYTFDVQILTEREQIVIEPECEQTDIFGNCVEEEEEEVCNGTINIFGQCVEEVEEEEECSGTVNIFGVCEEAAAETEEDSSCDGTVNIFGVCEPAVEESEEEEDTTCNGTVNIFGVCVEDTTEDSVSSCNGTVNIFGQCIEDEEVESPVAETTVPEIIDSDNTEATTGTTDDGNAEVGVDLTGLSDETLTDLGDIEDVEITVEIDGGDQEYQQVSCSGSIDIFGNCLTGGTSTNTGTTSGSSSTGSSAATNDDCSSYDIFGNCTDTGDDEEECSNYNIFG